MTNDSSTTAGKKALLDAFDTVLRTQAEEREAEQRAADARRRARARARPLIWTCTALVLFVASYLYIERPDWVFPSQAPVESPQLKDAGLRIGMANAAQHVEHYRQRTGRLPSTLAEAGAHGANLSYQILANGAWQLTGRNGGAPLTLSSKESLAAFLGDSFEIIARRGS